MAAASSTIATDRADATRILVPHFMRGRTRIAGDVEHRSRSGGVTVSTPAIKLDELVWPRTEPLPAQDTPIAEVVSFLVELGQRLTLDRNPHLQEALEQLSNTSTLGRRVLHNCYQDLPLMFRREGILAEAERNLGRLDVLDGWAALEGGGRRNRLRAFPPRLVHVLAGNAPIVPPITIIRGALSKGVHLLKMASNDLFTATAILRTMADIDADHPVTRSFCAVYWRGGDDQLESAILRSQYFDKIVVWGGEAAVRHVQKYLGPGLEMVSFDPKVSISMIGREAFASRQTLEQAAQRAAADVITLNQDACSCSRYQFVEGSVEQVDRYCEALLGAMAVDVRYGNGLNGPVPPQETREHLQVLGALEPIYRVFGEPDGRGMVVRSDEPLDLHPTGKLVSVVRVDDLRDAARFATVATQTVGIYPDSRRKSLRDALGNAGVQRIVALGEANGGGSFGGLPHDAGWPLHRFMRWVVDEGADD